MKFIKLTSLVFVATLAAQAQAETITHTSGPLPEAYSGEGAIQAPTAFSLANPTNYQILAYGNDHYLQVGAGNSATIDLDGATTFSFSNGWPDWSNQVTIDGQTFTAAQYLQGNYYITFTSDTPMTTAVFSDNSGGCCMEFGFASNWLGATTPVLTPPDTPPVAAVPEPGTYALLTAGLGIVALTVRRRNKVR